MNLNSSSRFSYIKSKIDYIDHILHTMFMLYFSLVFCFFLEGDAVAAKTHNGSIPVRKPQNHVHMPPELLVHINIPLDVLKSFYLLPSLMHRMESLMLASQLRREVAFNPSNSCIPSSLV